MTGDGSALFEQQQGWAADLLVDRKQEVADVAVDLDDNVYLLFRRPSAVVRCGPDGAVHNAIGNSLLSDRPHGVSVTPDGRVLVVDEGAHHVLIFDRDGGHLGGFGSGPSNPEFGADLYPRDTLAFIGRGYPPFTRPTRISVSSSGEFFVSDGYGNSRVHRFSPDGQLLASWGEPGIADGQFNTPHCVLVDRGGRVLVSDRENDRVQVFDQDGEFLESWTDFHRPQAIAQCPDGRFVVAEGSWRKNHVSPVNGPVPDAESRVSVIAESGEVLQRIGGESDPSVSFLAAHGIAADTAGSFYVAEVALSVGKAMGVHVDASSCISKFTPAGAQPRAGAAVGTV